MFESNPLLSMFGFISKEPEMRPLLTEWGMTQWWQDPEMQVHFFRPLTALTHGLDYTLWPESPLMHHIHSMAWMSASIWAFRKLLIATNMPLSAMVFAILLFAVEDAHAMAAGWIANRSLLLCACFAMLAASSHVQWRTGKAKRHKSLFFLGIALLCGEAGVSAMAFIAAWELIMQKRWASRLRAMAAPLALVVIWRLAYKEAGFGASEAGLYTNPTGEPWLFAYYMMERAPIYLMAQWFQFPIDVYATLKPTGRIALALLGLILTFFAIWRFSHFAKQNKAAQFWGLAMLFSIVPICAAMPMERLIFIPGIGAAALLGLYLSTLENPWRSPWLILHVYIAIGFGLLKTGVIPLFRDAIEQPAQHLAMKSNSDKDVIFINANALQAAYAFVLLSLENPKKKPRSITVLSHATQGSLVHRTNENTLIIETERGWFDTPIEGMLRSPKLPPMKGVVFQNTRYSATVEQNLPDGRPKRVRFEFSASLDDEKWTWVCAHHTQYGACTPPKIGDSMWLPGLLSKTEAP